MKPTHGINIPWQDGNKNIHEKVYALLIQKRKNMFSLQKANTWSPMDIQMIWGAAELKAHWSGQCRSECLHRFLHTETSSGCIQSVCITVKWWALLKILPHSCLRGGQQNVFGFLKMKKKESQYIEDTHTSNSRSWGSVSESGITATFVILYTSWSPGSLPINAFWRIRSSHHGKSGERLVKPYCKVIYFN